MNLDNKYPELSNLLLSWIDCDLSDEEIVKQLVWEYGDAATICSRELEGDNARNIVNLFKKRLETVMAEGEEVLAMEPFPNDWVGSLIDGAYYDPEDGRAWLRKVLQMVEEEAIRTGKLPADYAVKSRYGTVNKIDKRV